MRGCEKGRQLVRNISFLNFEAKGIPFQLQRNISCGILRRTVITPDVAFVITGFLLIGEYVSSLYSVGKTGSYRTVMRRISPAQDLNHPGSVCMCI